MSSLSLNKLKNQIGFVKPYVSAPILVGINNSPCCKSKVNKTGTTPLESSKTLKKMVQCSANQNPQPAAVSPEIKAASVRTGQLIDATILASVSTTDPTTRFSTFLPPPIPPPRFLQPGFVKYNVNSNAPKYVVPPCVGFSKAKQAI